MKYKFKCDCGESKTVDIPVSEISNAEILCDKCNKKMKRVWNTSIVVPDYLHEVTDINSRLKHSRPSGRSKIFY